MHQLPKSGVVAATGAALNEQTLVLSPLLLRPSPFLPWSSAAPVAEGITCSLRWSVQFILHPLPAQCRLCRVGDQVEAGDTLCNQAMKMFNKMKRMWLGWLSTHSERTTGRIWPASLYP